VYAEAVREALGVKCCLEANPSIMTAYICVTLHIHASWKQRVARQILGDEESEIAPKTAIFFGSRQSGMPNSLQTKTLSYAR
jgi:hypothetical protein